MKVCRVQRSFQIAVTRRSPQIHLSPNTCWSSVANRSVRERRSCSLKVFILLYQELSYKIWQNVLLLMIILVRHEQTSSIRFLLSSSFWVSTSFVETSITSTNRKSWVRTKTRRSCSLFVSKIRAGGFLNKILFVLCWRGNIYVRRESKRWERYSVVLVLFCETSCKAILWMPIVFHFGIGKCRNKTSEWDQPKEQSYINCSYYHLWNVLGNYTETRYQKELFVRSHIVRTLFRPDSARGFRWPRRKSKTKKCISSWK